MKKLILLTAILTTSFCYGQKVHRDKWNFIVSHYSEQDITVDKSTAVVAEEYLNGQLNIETWGDNEFTMRIEFFPGDKSQVVGQYYTADFKISTESEVWNFSYKMKLSSLDITKTEGQYKMSLLPQGEHKNFISSLKKGTRLDITIKELEPTEHGFTLLGCTKALSSLGI